MANGPMAKVFGWYDNEWGYSCRLVDLVAKVAATLPAASRRRPCGSRARFATPTSPASACSCAPT